MHPHRGDGDKRGSRWPFTARRAVEDTHRSPGTPQAQGLSVPTARTWVKTNALATSGPGALRSGPVGGTAAEPVSGTVAGAERQYERFEGLEVTMQDIAAILEAYGKETGLGLGEG
ncbi:hypothetical protein [Streptomyces somaliensis]|uniref:hypothetical protein n=1 Tax=Streptomyces somaliensis TaxID=78355 RepID=UPI0034E97DFF|nr:hypothetical protein [Streptomyces somaliensis]